MALRRSRDDEGSDTSARIPALEEQLSDARAEARRWRAAYDALKAVLVAGSGPNKELAKIDEAVRVWATLGER